MQITPQELEELKGKNEKKRALFIDGPRSFTQLVLYLILIITLAKLLPMIF